MQRCKGANVQGCKYAKVQRCKDAKVQRRKGIKVQECKGVKVQMCKGDKLSGLTGCGFDLVFLYSTVLYLARFFLLVGISDHETHNFILSY